MNLSSLYYVVIQHTVQCRIGRNEDFQFEELHVVWKSKENVLQNYKMKGKIDF